MVFRLLFVRNVLILWIVDCDGSVRFIPSETLDGATLCGPQKAVGSQLFRSLQPAAASSLGRSAVQLHRLLGPGVHGGLLSRGHQKRRQPAVLLLVTRARPGDT